MSNDTPPRILADKYQPGGEFYNRVSPPPIPVGGSSSEHLPVGESSSDDHNKNFRQPYRRRTPKPVIVTAIILGIFLLAGMKNPSQSEGRNQVKAYMCEKLNDYVAQEAAKNGESDSLGTFLVTAFAPAIIEAMVHVETTDYILFTTFEGRVDYEGQQKNLLSGIIIFGKIIPLSTDLAPH